MISESTYFNAWLTKGAAVYGGAGRGTDLYPAQRPLPFRPSPVFLGHLLACSVSLPLHPSPVRRLYSLSGTSAFLMDLWRILPNLSFQPSPVPCNLSTTDCTMEPAQVFLSSENILKGRPVALDWMLALEISSKLCLRSYTSLVSCDLHGKLF